MAGVLDFLDTLTQTVGQVAGKAVEAAGSVATATIAAKAQDKINQQETTSALQNVQASSVLPWVIGGGLLLVGAYFLLRK